jgi:hypothetical protein
MDFWRKEKFSSDWYAIFIIFPKREMGERERRERKRREKRGGKGSGGCARYLFGVKAFWSKKFL